MTAFAALIEMHKDSIFSTCMYYADSYHDAQDALAETMSLAWLKLDSFRKDASSFKSWLAVIAKNVCMAIYRKRKETVSLDEPPEALQAPKDTLASNETAIDEQITTAQTIREALSYLDEQSRQALILHEVAGLKMSEIAVEFGWSVDNAKARVSRSRRKMKKLLVDMQAGPN